MRIPDGPNGFPTLSASQLRMYGAGGFLLDDQEQEKGCPRLYKARYVEHRVDTGQRPDMLWYGGFFHDVMYRMEADGLTPDEALAAAFDPAMPQAFWTEAREDLDRYLLRGAAPADRYATLAVETRLTALLYEDEDFGPIYYQGILDWLGIDPEVPYLLHFVDYKTNRTPPAADEIHGDVQMRGYQWLVEENAEQWVTGPAEVVGHLDVIKFREIEVTYTEEQIDDWKSWAIAVARSILRDEKGDPAINSGCAWCPVRYDCPAFAALPTVAADLATKGKDLTDPQARLRWRDQANALRLLLEKAVKRVDQEIDEQARSLGGMVVGDQAFTVEPNWVTTIDMRRLHQVIGSDLFYRIATTSKTAIERETKDADSAVYAAAQETITRQPAGSKVVRKKVSDG